MPEKRPAASLRAILQTHAPALLVLLYQVFALACFVLYLFLALPYFHAPGIRTSQFLLPYLSGLVYLGCSIWVFSLRRRDAAGRAFSLMSSAGALALAGLFDLNTSRALLYPWTISLALAAGALLNFGLHFPQEAGLLRRFPAVRWLALAPALMLAAALLPALRSAEIAAFQPARLFALGYLGLVGAGLLGENALRMGRHPSPIIREHARLALWSALLSFGPAAVWLAADALLPAGLGFSAALFLPACFFPLVTAIAVLRHRLLNTDFLLSQGLLFALLSILIITGYALLVSGFSLALGSILPVEHPLVTGLLIFLFAVAFTPLRRRMQILVNGYFFRGRTAYHEKLQAFSRSLTQAVELQEILHRLWETVEENLHPAPIHVFVYDPFTGQYAAVPEPGQALPATDLRFAANSPLVETLSIRQSSLFLTAGEPPPGSLAPDRPRLALLGAQLFVPLPGRQQLGGWLALGPRRSGEAYSHRDLNFLEALCDQAALAVERAQVVIDLEQRVQEMNTLTRIAQGLNITLAFDDLLELLYAQTSRVIPCKDFWITLYRPDTRQFIHAFYLQNDERYPRLENTPIPEGQGLEQEIWRERRGIRTDDYERECRSRGLLPTVPGLLAWMGAPLNAGSDTIGAISLASRDPAVTFTARQAALLQAIADLAAGAMVKARLLQETERKARQLASLNEIGRSLSSTLEHRPLLDEILQNAVKILNCEAGSLFLVDDETQELVFEVTAGPVAAHLLGQRLPPGVGLVGKAVVSGQPVIANRVQADKGWFDKADRQTGFVTHNLLVVPLRVKDRVIGVIEVINKLDGSIFNADDQELLSTFASQAAVAVENSRLYTQTDQALAARVEELSVMQRIGRELSSSLELERTLNITLDWALSRTEADAGLIGMMKGANLEVLIYRGYDHELDPYRPEGGGEHPILPAGLPALESLVNSLNPQVHSFSFSPDSPTIPIPGQSVQNLALLQTLAQQGFILAGARRQASVPIRREMEVNAVLLLESRRANAFSKEELAFLARLGDHASLAVSNAQLYAAVQAANLAKSEFVSFVSHELKTPMTSIKGYADLLSAGAVGPINEAQASFLHTIRSNVNRMATLVSDLADVSRIEAGRLRLDFSAVSVEELVHEVVRSARQQIEEKSQLIELDLASGLPPAWGDRNRLLQVLVNLVSNANKYTPPEGKITISAHCEENRWDPNGAPQVIHLSVRDTGFGIQPADQKRIFQKFFRSEEQNIRDAPGTGLGLNISRHLVEIQGGQIWFESEPGAGSCFHFTIPVSSAQDI